MFIYIFFKYINFKQDRKMPISDELKYSTNMKLPTKCSEEKKLVIEYIIK